MKKLKVYGKCNFVLSSGFLNLKNSALLSYSVSGVCFLSADRTMRVAP